MMKKVRPNAEVKYSSGNDGRDEYYYIQYCCPVCGKNISKHETACDLCGTFFDWSKVATIEIVRNIVWR